MKLLAVFAAGSLFAFAAAVWAITDWLEIDWRMQP